MTLSTIRQNLFLKWHQSNQTGHESEVLIPVEFEMQIQHHLKRGMSTRYGFHQEVKYDIQKASFHLMMCLQKIGDRRPTFLCNNLDKINQMIQGLSDMTII